MSYDPKPSKIYVSTDIESSGPYPWDFAMLSFGACIVGDAATRNNPANQFYAELKPWSRLVEKEAIAVGCRGLHCLKDLKHLPEYNPGHKDFDPQKVLDVLEEKGEDPKIVMPRFADWIERTTKGYTPIFAAAPVLFDGMFIAYGFSQFYCKDSQGRYIKENPFL